MSTFILAIMINATNYQAISGKEFVTKELCQDAAKILKKENPKNEYKCFNWGKD